MVYAEGAFSITRYQMVTIDDLTECVCCGSLHDSIGFLCPACDDAGCNRFTDTCNSDHIPVDPSLL